MDQERRPSLLLAGLESGERNEIKAELRRAGFGANYQTLSARSRLGQSSRIDCADILLASGKETEFIRSLPGRNGAVPCVAICADADEGRTALSAGADDYVLSSDLARLPVTLTRELALFQERVRRQAVERALASSEQRYEEHVENANDVVFSIDLAGNFTSFNRAGEEVSGYSRADLRTMNIAQVLAPQSLDLARHMIQQKLVDNRPTTYELDIIARDGHHIPLEVSTRLLTHEGVPAGVQGIGRDIAERKRAAEALRESEQRYRGLFESASDIVYTHDLEGNFTSVNRATERVISYSRDEVLGMNIAQVVVPEHLFRAREMIGHKLESEVPTTYELDVLTRDGRRVTLEINSQLIYHEGKPSGVQGIARDVTERRQAEEDLRARERKQASIAGFSQRALAGGDLQGLLDDAVRCVTDTLNLEFCTVTELFSDDGVLLARSGVGWRPGLLGNTTIEAGTGSQAGYALLCGEPVVVEDFETESRFCQPSVLHEHRARSGVSVIIHGPKNPFGVLSAFTRRLRTFSQDDVHFLQSVANIVATAIERLRLEDARAEQSMQLAALVLQAQEEERKRIARELHDETAQSLSTLLMHLDLLEPHIPGDDDVLRIGFRRVAGLARRTLDETRALSHDLRPTILDDVGLAAAIQWYAEEYDRSDDTQVEVRVEGEPDGRLSPAVEVALFRIAQEALTNARKHSGASSIQVALLFMHESAKLTVHDNGKGFDPQNVPGPTREGRLGLYGMHERAALLGGGLTVTADGSDGTTVTVELPLDAVADVGSLNVDAHARSGR